MGLNLKNNIITIVESDYTGIVFKYGKTPVIGFQPFADLLGPSLDISIKKALNYCLFPFLIPVINDGVKDLVFAVFGPCLGKGFKFNISKSSRKPDFGPFFLHIRPLDILPYLFHLLEIECQYPVF